MADETEKVELGTAAAKAPTPAELTKTSSTELISLDNPSGDVVVLARNPEEMVTAQSGLIQWAQQKLAFERRELKEAEENLEYAKSLKHRTTGWTRQVGLAKKRAIYYEKVLAALTEGYCIVPNFPVQVIATRTNKKAVTKKKIWNRWRPDNVRHEQLPPGVGKYVGPEPEFYRGAAERTLSDGRKRTDHYIQLTGEHEQVDFPFKLVKPQVMADLKRTAMLKIFDDIGVLPQVESRARRPDPMLIGRIRRREAGGSDVNMSFLISWWIDSRDL